MSKKIVLRNPITVDGKKVKELKYDTDKISVGLFIEAEGAKSKESKSYGRAMEVDYAFHLYLGMAAIIAENPSFAFEDLERLVGVDVMEVSKIGRNFTLPGEVNLLEEGSTEQSEISPKSTTQA